MDNLKVSAIQKERWVSFNITHDKGFDSNSILDVLYTDLNLNTSVLRAMYFQQYELENNSLLKIFCKTTYENYIYELKPYVIDLLEKINTLYVHEDPDQPKLSITFEEFAWVSNHGGNKILTEALFPKVSSIIHRLKNEYGEKWGMDLAIEKAIAFSVIFLFSLESSKKEIHHFYHWFFDRRLQTILIPEGQDKFIKRLTQEIDTNYQEQKDIICSYVDLLINAYTDNSIDFEEAWALDWFQICKDITLTINKEEGPTRIITPYSYAANENLPYSRGSQERWAIYGHMHETIQNMLGIDFLLELNLLYSLKESTKGNAV